MRSKKNLQLHHLRPHHDQKQTPTPQHGKRKLQQIKSAQHKYRQTVQQQPVFMHSAKIIKIPDQNIVNDYDWQKTQRQTMKYVPIGEGNPSVEQPSPPQFRSQRNSHSRQFLQRENKLMNHESIRQSNHSHNNSQQRIKVYSVENKDKSLSRSENGSVKKKGIQITKTLLKRISGMYTDKDFQNGSSYMKSNRQSTGINNSGRVNDEYQLSQLDIQGNTGHMFNTSSSNHHLSFNDSVHKIQEVNQRGKYSGVVGSRKDNQEDSGHFNRIFKESFVQKVTHDQKFDTRNNSGHWRNQDSNGFEHKSKKLFQQTPHQKMKTKEKPRIALASPKKDLTKVRSYDLLNQNRPESQSIVIESPGQSNFSSKKCAPISRPGSEQFVIRSKNKTLDQMSLKESMVIGFDNYYQ